MKTRPTKALLTLVFLGPLTAWACDLCEKNQPAGLEKITHGPGPSGPLDYIIMYGAAVIVAITLFYSIKFLIKPQEDNPEHAKNIAINQGF